MKVVILAGGLGTRISEETNNKPKPMVKIGPLTLIEHIMNIYSKSGITEFIIATGYMREVIENYFEKFTKYSVTPFFTGESTQTGGRIRFALEHIGKERAIATYGDGLANIKISDLIKKHDQSNLLATVTAVRPPARFGVLESSNGVVTHFGEKNQADAGWINGGYFVLEPEVANYIHGAEEPFETGAMPRLVREGNLGVFHHEGFWKPMDTLREKLELCQFAEMETPPWLR